MQSLENSYETVKTNIPWVFHLIHRKHSFKQLRGKAMLEGVEVAFNIHSKLSFKHSLNYNYLLNWPFRFTIMVLFAFRLTKEQSH